MSSSKSSRLPVSAALLGLALVSSANAQQFSPGQHLLASYSYGSSSAVSHHGDTGADLGAQYSNFEYRYDATVDKQFGTSIGFGVSHTALDAPASLPLPEKLEEYSLRLGGRYQLEDPHWSLFASASPGFREAGSGLSGDAFNVPLIAGATYAQKPGLIWMFGAAYNSFSDYKLLPFVGVYWRFAPQWTLSVGFPQSGVAYDVNDTLKLRAGASFKGGSYWVKPTTSSKSSEASYGDTLLEYREVRVGLGADWKLTKDLRLSLDAGVVADRKLKYYQLGQSYDGAAAGFVSVALGYDL